MKKMHNENIKDVIKNSYAFFITRLIAGYRKQTTKIIKKNSSFSLMIFSAVLKANKEAFTLAEILVTLGIIGVIASMTIPNLVQDIQDAQFKTAWKKAYADFAQAGKRLGMDNANNLSGLFGSDISNDNIMRDNLLGYLNYVKKCDSNSNVTSGCWHSLGTWYKFSGQAYPYNWNNSAGFVLNNGELVAIAFSVTDCSDSGAANDDACGDIAVDVNGFKPPNKVGRDIYRMYLLKSGAVVPWGIQGDAWINNAGSYGCDPADNDVQGWTCSAQYIYQ